MARRMTAEQRAEQSDALEMLREWLPAGSTIWTVVQRVGSGNVPSKAIVPLIIRHGSIQKIGWLIGRAGIARYNASTGAVAMSGGNTSLEHELVSAIGRALYREGFACLGENFHGYRSCPSNEHSGDSTRDYSPTRIHRNDSGYAFFVEQL